MARDKIAMVPALTAQGYPTGTAVAVERTTNGGDAALVVIATPNGTGGFDLVAAATDAKLEELRLLLAGINTSTDQLETLVGALGTQSTLAAIKGDTGLLATEAKLEQVRAAVAAVNLNTDTLETIVATDAKLEAVRLLLVAINANTDTLETIVATDAKLEQVRVLLAAINANTDTLEGITATETTLAALNAKVPTLGSKQPVLSAPVTLPNDVVVTGGSIAATLGVVNLELLTNTASGWFDAANFHSVSFQITTGAGISAGVVQFEQTNDTALGAAGIALNVVDLATLNVNPVTSLTLAANVTRIFAAPIMARFIRVRISTAVAGGTVQAVAVGSQLPFASLVQNVQQATSASLNVTVAGTQTVQGSAAHAAAVAGNPAQVGFESRVTNRTKTADAQNSRPVVDAGGRVIQTYAARERLFASRTALSTTTETTIVAAGGMSVFRDLVLLILENTSAAPVGVSIRDSLAGTVRLSVTLAAGETLPLVMPGILLPQATAASTWTAQLSMAVAVNISAVAVEAL